MQLDNQKYIAIKPIVFNVEHDIALAALYQWLICVYYVFAKPLVWWVRNTQIPCLLLNYELVKLLKYYILVGRWWTVLKIWRANKIIQNSVWYRWWVCTKLTFLLILALRCLLKEWDGLVAARGLCEIIIVQTLLASILNACSTVILWEVLSTHCLYWDY